MDVVASVAYAATQAKPTASAIKETDNTAHLDISSAKQADSGKKRDVSRPVSTSSGTSVGSTAESQLGSAGNNANRLGESLDSLSTMPTPRNTFLYPPTGLNIPDKPRSANASAGASGGAQGTANNKVVNWVSEHHQQQLQELLEKKGIPGDKSAHAEQPRLPCSQASYDDSYFLLGQPADQASSTTPASREAAMAMLRKIANADRASSSKRTGQRQRSVLLPDMPLPLVPPVDTLSRLEETLMGVLARRSVPNRTYTHSSQRGGAGSTKPGTSATGIGSAAALAASAKASSRRKQRMSMMSSGQESNSSAAGNADDKRSMRSRISAISGDIARLPSGATPYTDLNDHIDRLTACMSRLQASPLDPASATASSAAAAAASTSTASAQQLHKRQSSTSSAGGKSFVSAQSLIATPLTNESLPAPPSLVDLQSTRNNAASRLSPVSESPAGAESASLDEQPRPRSSSHASVVSGTSTESKRRIMVTEVLTSSHFPNLFGNSITDLSQADRPQMRHSPSAVTISAHSAHSDSIHSQTSSGSKRQQQQSPLLPPPPPLSSGAMQRESFFGPAASKAPSVISRSTGNSASSSLFPNPTVTVRDITPAGRLALWMNMHSNMETSKTSLWRRRQWHRRFAIFAGNVLYMFKSSSPAAVSQTTIRLSTSTIVCVNDTFHGRSWVVEVTLPPPSPDMSITQSWYLQTEMRGEMIMLLKQLKTAIGELQVQPDVERREEERLRNRRKKQRKEAKAKTDVCPWEVDEFSEGSTGATESEECGDGEGEDGGNVPSEKGIGGMHFIPDDELFPSDDDEPLAIHTAAPNLESYSMSNAMAAAAASAASGEALLTVHSAQEYTGTGGIAEWGAHRLHVPYNRALSSGLKPEKTRSFSTDPSASLERRPSLADAIAPPKSAASTGHGSSSPEVSPRTQAQAVRMRGIAALANSAVRNSMMLRSDASALIDQMFASASKELSSPTEKDGSGEKAVGGRNLSVVSEED
ncbi:hypothetical protein LPJ72_000245 [Coemansia sp. Benny D160-2]|nr:hypothetical protein LPJ72_000245 [Coemansia sp. Benny D160-2]